MSDYRPRVLPYAYYLSFLPASRTCPLHHRLPKVKLDIISVGGSSMTKSYQASNRRRKTLYIKIRDGNPSIKSRRQKRTQVVETTQRKNKSKTINQKKRKKQGKKKGENNATLSLTFISYIHENFTKGSLMSFGA